VKLKGKQAGRPELLSFHFSLLTFALQTYNKNPADEMGGDVSDKIIYHYLLNTNNC
jgi:hypothetical protein